MNLKKTTLFACLILLWTGDVCADHLDQATFAPETENTSGWSRVQNPHGGRYVYGPQLKDGRDLSAKRFALGRPQRQEYELYSAEEEEALWNYREKKRREMEEAQHPPVTHRRTSRVKLHIEWPKVVVIGDKTCVPRIGFVSASDWKEHLVCWSSEKRDVE